MRAFLFAFLLISLLSCSSNNDTKSEKVDGSVIEESAETNKRNLQRHAKPDTLTIAMCGDIMMGTTFPDVCLPPEDGKNLFKDTKFFTGKADIAVANLEGTLCDGGTSTKKMSSVKYAFRTPIRFGHLLKDAGYDFLSMANNHVNDFGPEGIASTEHVLDSLGIMHSGIKGSVRYALVMRNGVRYGLCAFGHNSYTLCHSDLLAVKDILDQLDLLSDIVIVSFHGGAEGVTKNHLPYGKEMFLGENRGSLREFAHFCIDNGADVIYGHGPHVVRCMEVYKDRFIAYSLGNFCTPYAISLSGLSGYSPVVDIRIKSDGSFISGMIHSFIQKRGLGPCKDAKNSVAKEISSLTLSDMPDSRITIDAQGYIKLK